jgi:CubicO group peptidase (beta-lactamase class C family)
VTHSGCDTLPATSAYLLGEVEARSMMTAVQVCVVDGQGNVHGFAAGDAAVDVDTSTIFRVWCAAKPFTALAVARLVERGDLDLDAPLVDVLPDVQTLTPRVGSRPIALRHVLNHTAGLHVPTAPQMELLPNGRRWLDLRSGNWVPDGWRTGEDAAYSEVLAWYVIGAAIERVTGEPLYEHLRRSVLDPFGMSRTWIGMTMEDYEANVDAIGVNYDFRAHRAYPVLFERNERLCCDTNCSYGGYTSANDLARFYARVLRRARGGGDPALPSGATVRSFCRSDRRTAYDLTFQRECAFGLGFMTELAAHNFGPCPSPDAFGHSGWAGSSFGFADPREEVAAAVITNGLLPPAAAHLSRQRIVRCIYEDLGLVGAQSMMVG